MQRDRRAVWVLIALWLLLQLPFLSTAFRIDEPNILALARQIARDPGDPYGFTINWNGTEEPAFTTLANPPLVPAWLALWSKAFGWSEASMHAAMLPLGIAALAAAAGLSRAIGVAPLLGVSLILCSPAFFLGAQVVMPDLTMLALVLGALAALGRFAGGGRWPWLAAAVLCAFAAPLAKYNAFALAPALGLAALIAKGRRFSFAAVALSPVAALVLWGFWSASAYGEAHFVAINRMQQAAAVPPWTGAFAALGLGVLPLALLPFLLAQLRTRMMQVVAAATVVALALQAWLVLGYPIVPSTLFGASVAAGVLFTIVVVVRGAQAWRRRDALVVALVGLVAMTLAMQEGLLFTSVRYLLPLLPAVLVIPAASPQPARTSTALAFFGFLLVVSLAIGDAAAANVYRNVIRDLRPRIEHSARFFFAGHWGLQHYAEEAGGTAIDRAALPAIGERDLVVVARNAFPGIDPGTIPGGVGRDVTLPWPVRTIDCGSAANFYGNAIGGCEHFPAYLPFGIGTGVYERITVAGPGG